MSLSVKPRKNRPHSPYVTSLAEIVRVEPVTELEKVFTVRHTIGGGERLAFLPGQFFMVGLPGYGEAPISISAGDGEVFELCIRRVGNLTNALHRLDAGGTFTIRGPFGRGFDVDAMEGHSLLFVAGGIGLVPMRSLVREVLSRKDRFGRLTLLYGARTPDEMLFCTELTGWREAGMDVRLTVDRDAPGWDGNVGLITTLIPGVEADPERTLAVIIGPPVMYRFVVFELDKLAIPRSAIYVSLERRMKCGLGKCGHCQINSLYACQEGPVFTLNELEGMHESL